MNSYFTIISYEVEESEKMLTFCIVAILRETFRIEWLRKDLFIFNLTGFFFFFFFFSFYLWHINWSHNKGVRSISTFDKNQLWQLIRWIHKNCLYCECHINDYEMQNTVMVLSFWTDMPGQTVQTQIRLLLEEQSDQCLHWLQFRLHCLDSLLYGRAT